MSGCKVLGFREIARRPYMIQKLDGEGKKPGYSKNSHMDSGSHAINLLCPLAAGLAILIVVTVAFWRV